MPKPANVEQFEGSAGEWLLKAWVNDYAKDNRGCITCTDINTRHGIVTVAFTPHCSEF